MTSAFQNDSIATFDIEEYIVKFYEARSGFKKSLPVLFLSL